jgi:hypothetical protein
MEGDRKNTRGGLVSVSKSNAKIKFLRYIRAILLAYSFINKSKDKLNAYDPSVSWNSCP